MHDQEYFCLIFGLFFPLSLETAAASPTASAVAPPTPNLLTTAHAVLSKGSDRFSSKQQASSDQMDACYPQTADELVEAVQELDCSLLFLTNSDPQAYLITQHIMVDRPIRIVGHPVFLPVIDASTLNMAPRAFRVVEGGFLDLQYIRVRAGVGETKERPVSSNQTQAESAFGETSGTQQVGVTGKILETRGGSVAIEQGASGANFEGVIFLSVANSWESVQEAIQATYTGMGGRTYGGHIFIAGGSVKFTNCHFWTTAILLPLTDQFSLGGDILMLAGTLTVTACTFTSTTMFGSLAGAGMVVGILGGVGVFTFCVIQESIIANHSSGPGQTILVGGGVQIITGMDFRLVAVVLAFVGFGDFATAAGVLVMTGVTIENAYGVLFAVGAGFYTAVGSGTLVQIGVSYVQYCGPSFNALAGSSIFVGSGASINVGVPSLFAYSTNTFSGIGGFSYNGAGVSVWVGSPSVNWASTYSFFGLGGTLADSAGFTTFVGSPTFSAYALFYFAGQGGTLWKGSGGAVVALSPVYAPASRQYVSGNADNFYVAGRSFNDAKGLTYASRSKFASTNSKNKTNGMRKMTRHKQRRVRKDIVGGSKGKHEENEEIKHESTFEKRKVQKTGHVEAKKGKRYLKSDNVGLPYPWDWQHYISQKGDDAEPSNRFYMYKTKTFETKDIYDQNITQSLASWVPLKMLDAAKSLEEGFGKHDAQNRLRMLPQVSVDKGDAGMATIEKDLLHVGDNSTAASLPVKRKRHTLYVEEGIDVCQICEVDSIDGPGATRCEYTAAACAALDQAHPDESEGARFDIQDINFEPTCIVIGTLLLIWTDTTQESTTRTERLEASDLRDAMRFWMRDEMDLPDTQVSVFAKGPDKVTSQWLSEDPVFEKRASRKMLEATSLSCPFPESQEFTVAFVAHNVEAVEILTIALSGKEGHEGEVAAFLSSRIQFSASSDLFLCSVEASYEERLIIPAYNSPDFLKSPIFSQDAHSPFHGSRRKLHGELAMSVRLIDPSNPGLSLAGGWQHNLVTRQTYKLLLQGFLPSQPLEVVMVKVTGEVLTEKRSASPANPQEGQKACSRCVIECITSEVGSAEVPYSIPADLPTGEYYLQVRVLGTTGMPQAFSSVYSVASKAMKRKLYGPLWSVGGDSAFADK